MNKSTLAIIILSIIVLIGIGNKISDRHNERNYEKADHVIQVAQQAKMFYFNYLVYTNTSDTILADSFAQLHDSLFDSLVKERDQYAK